MEEYRHGTHSIFRLHIHIVWCTKYRKPVLERHIGERLRDLVKEICSNLGVEILKGLVTKEHIHILVSIPPKISVSRLVQRLKGKTSYKLQSEFVSLRRQYWDNGCGGEDILHVAQGM